MTMNTKQPTLSNNVIKAIGAMPPWVWDSSHTVLHKAALPEAIDEYDEEQTFVNLLTWGNEIPMNVERDDGR